MRLKDEKGIPLPAKARNSFPSRPSQDNNADDNDEQHNGADYQKDDENYHDRNSVLRYGDNGNDLHYGLGLFKGYQAANFGYDLDIGDSDDDDDLDYGDFSGGDDDDDLDYGDFSGGDDDDGLDYGDYY